MVIFSFSYSAVRFSNFLPSFSTFSTFGSETATRFSRSNPK